MRDAVGIGSWDGSKAVMIAGAWRSVSLSL